MQHVGQQPNGVRKGRIRVSVQRCGIRGTCGGGDAAKERTRPARADPPPSAAMHRAPARSASHLTQPRAHTEPRHQTRRARASASQTLCCGPPRGAAPHAVAVAAPAPLPPAPNSHGLLYLQALAALTPQSNGRFPAKWGQDGWATPCGSATSLSPRGTYRGRWGVPNFHWFLSDPSPSLSFSGSDGAGEYSISSYFQARPSRAAQSVRQRTTPVAPFFSASVMDNQAPECIESRPIRELMITCTEKPPMTYPV